MEDESLTRLPDAPTVTVAMPVYNRIPWAVEALRSVLDQTYTDFEVVVVDDGSTEDPTPLMMTDRRVRYFRQENRGASAARNLGVSLARGRYVAFLDSDDLFAPDKLEKQVLAMEGSPHVAISHTSYILIDAEGETIDEVYSGRYSGKVYPGIYTDSHHIATPTVMVRSEALDRTLGFNEAVRYGEDTLLWAILTSKSALLGIDEPLAKIRIHGGNAISNLDAAVEGADAVTRHGILKDKNLRPHRRRRLLSVSHVGMAHLHLERRSGVEALGAALRALRAWPLNYRIYLFLAMLAYRRVTGKFRRKQA